MEKHGFIYFWYDKKRKMYYIGSHWGTENDGYICSSNRMRDAYRRRPNDFKRKIIVKNIKRNVLLDEEHKWLSLIKDEELGKKYYNLRKHKWGHWSTDISKRESVIQKMKREFTEEHKRKISEAKKRWRPTEEHKQKTRQTLINRPQTKELIEKRVESRKNNGNYVMSDEQKRKISETQMGRKLSDEQKQKISESMKRHFSEKNK